MDLPDLKYEYSHSVIKSVKTGPRQEVTLAMQTIEWLGQSSEFSHVKSVRFGGVLNFEEVKVFFTRHQTVELAYLRYSTEHHSKPSNLFVELRSERTDDELTIQCSSIQAS